MMVVQNEQPWSMSTDAHRDLAENVELKKGADGLGCDLYVDDEGRRVSIRVRAWIMLFYLQVSVRGASETHCQSRQNTSTRMI